MWHRRDHGGEPRKAATHLQHWACFFVRWVPMDCFKERRFWHYALLPVAIAFADATVYGMAHNYNMKHWVLGMVNAASRVLPLLLLARVLEQGAKQKFQLRVSVPFLALSLACATLSMLTVTQASHPWHIQGRAGYPELLAALWFAVAAALPVRQLARRALQAPGMTALFLVSLLPYAGHWLLKPIWLACNGLISSFIIFFVEAQGFAARTDWYHDPKWGGAIIIRSQWWEIEVVKGCSDLIMVLYFVGLFMAMLLSRPRRMHRPMKVAAALVIGVALLISVNCWRIASLVAFASALIEACGRSNAVYREISGLHNHGGASMVYGYTAFFGLYFWACARWLDRERT